MSARGKPNLRDRMRAIGERRAAAEAIVKATTEEAAPLVHEAHELGIPITEIARDTGLSRVTIYAILRRKG